MAKLISDWMDDLSISEENWVSIDQFEDVYEI